MNEKDHANIITYPPLIYLSGLFIGWGVHKFVYFLGISPQFNNGYWGEVIIALGFFIIIFAGWSFKKGGQNPDPHTSTPNIYTGSIYGLTRNPMYLGMAIITFGAGLMLNTWWVIIFLIPVLVIVQNGVIKKEEEYLTQKFGEEYREYLKKVRRWL